MAIPWRIKYLKNWKKRFSTGLEGWRKFNRTSYFQPVWRQRTPVRDVHRLEQEGLVQLTPNKGAVVIGISEKDLRDIYDIRMKLEGLASRWAAEQITEEDAKSLRDILELQEFYTAKGDLDQLRNLDSQFHERIYEISGSRTLRQTLSSLHHSIQRYRKMSFATKGRAQKVMIEHQRIVDAIASHDPEAAEKATVDHIEMAATNMLKNLGLSSEEDVHADSAAL